MNALAELNQSCKAVHPLDLLFERAAALADRTRNGSLPFLDAVDMAYSAADWSGLIDRYGDDVVQLVLADAWWPMSSNGLDTNAPSPGKRPAMFDIYTASNDVLDTLATHVDRKQVSAINYDNFLERQLPPRQTLLAPWLPMRGLAMIHAPRGIGKTHIALGTAWAVATGTGFLRWKVPEDVGTHRVLLLDGEMPGVLLQERLSRVVKASGEKPPLPEYLRISAADLYRDGLPDLASLDAQQFYADVIADADLVIVDNLSTLCRGLKENEADSWTPVQNWLLAQRRANKSVLVIHHGGKSGTQRGTSRKEDVLDTVIGLRKPPDYQADQGARFEIHFEKARGFYGLEAEPFEARLVGELWQESEIKSGDDLATLNALREQGLTIRDIAERTGLSKSTVQRRLEGGVE